MKSAASFFFAGIHYDLRSRMRVSRHELESTMKSSARLSDTPRNVKIFSTMTKVSVGSEVLLSTTAWLSRWCSFATREILRYIRTTKKQWRVTRHWGVTTPYLSDDGAQTRLKRSKTTLRIVQNCANVFLTLFVRVKVAPRHSEKRIETMETSPESTPSNFPAAMTQIECTRNWPFFARWDVVARRYPSRLDLNWNTREYTLSPFGIDYNINNVRND